MLPRNSGCVAIFFLSLHLPQHGAGRTGNDGRIGVLGWRAQWPLRRGPEVTYAWIAAPVVGRDYAMARAS